MMKSLSLFAEIDNHMLANRDVVQMRLRSYMISNSSDDAEYNLSIHQIFPPNTLNDFRDKSLVIGDIGQIGTYQTVLILTTIVQLSGPERNLAKIWRSICTQLLSGSYTTILAL
jgi:hypothetical protein